MVHLELIWCFYARFWVTSIQTAVGVHMLLDWDSLTHDMDSEDTQWGSFVGWKHMLSNLHGISRHLVWHHHPSMKNTVETMELHTYLLFYTVPDLPYLTNIAPVPCYVSVLFHGRLCAYNGTELWGLKELHESSSYLSRSHSGRCRRWKAQDTYAILGNIPVFWCFCGVSNLHDLVCLVYILDKLSLWSCFLLMLFLC